MSKAPDFRSGWMAAFCALWLSSPLPAAAQGVPVIDAAAIAEAADNVKAAAQQVEQLNAMLTQVQGIVKTIGQQGVPTLLFDEALSQSGISQFGPPVNDLLASVQSTASAVQSTLAAGQQAANSFQSVLAEADKLKGQLGGVTAKPDFSSFASAQAWVRNELTVAQNANVTTVSLTRKARNMLAGEAAANAYAMALNARQQVSQMADRTAQLAAKATAANDLRGDLAANTAVMLAMHDEMAQVQALMAAVLEVQSASRLAEMDPMASSGAAGASASGSSSAGGN
jgi:hypothetical protein